MDEKRYNRCLVLRELMKSPLFEEAVQAVKDDISRETMATKRDEYRKREDLFNEYQGLDRLVGKLNEIAAEATVEETKVTKAKSHAAE